MPHMATASSEKQPRSRYRKSRSGCVRCKHVKRIKCDETLPSCLRCVKAGVRCDYAFTQIPASQRARQILPAAALAPRPLASGAAAAPVTRTPLIRQPCVVRSLSGVDAHYHDRFRTRILANLGIRGHSPDFWYRCLFREGFRDPCIRSGLVALGAMDCAIETFGRNHGSPVPIYLFEMSESDETYRHFAHATRMYSKSLAELRTRLAGDLTASHPMGPPGRTALIASLIFILFETMQGNRENADVLIKTFMGAFGLPLLTSLCQPRPRSERLPWRTGKGVDDSGVEEGAMFLLRLAAYRELCDPMQSRASVTWADNIRNRDPLADPLAGSLVPVPHDDEGDEEILLRWDKAFALALTWLNRISALVANQSEIAPDQLGAFEFQQARAAAFALQWHNLMQRKVKASEEKSSADPLGVVWKLTYHTSIVMRVFVESVLDPTDLSWDARATECLAALGVFESMLDSDLSTYGPLVQRVLDDVSGALLLCVVIRCRDREVRRKGRALCRRVALRPGVCVIWATLVMLMRLEATCAAEEAWRRPEDGVIPVERRHRWIGFSWNEDRTLLTIVNRRIGSDHDELLFMRVDEFDCVRDAVPICYPSTSYNLAYQHVGVEEKNKKEEERGMHSKPLEIRPI